MQRLHRIPPATLNTEMEEESTGQDPERLASGFADKLFQIDIHVTKLLTYKGK